VPAELSRHIYWHSEYWSHIIHLLPHMPRATQGKGKVVLVLNYDVWRSGCISPRFLDPGTSWRWVVSITPRPIYPRGSSPQYSLDRRLGEPREDRILPLRGLELRSLDRPAIASRYTNCVIQAPYSNQNYIYIYIYLCVCYSKNPKSVTASSYY
jgi:hypothetical protein